MEISSDRAYWFLESYRTRCTRLHFAGRIAGEEAACDAMIVAIDRDLHLAVVELFEDGGSQSWFRSIPLNDATFYLSMMGEPDFNEWAEPPFHLVLALRYSDGTTLLFAERSRSPEPPNVTRRDLEKEA